MHFFSVNFKTQLCFDMFIVNCLDVFITMCQPPVTGMQFLLQLLCDSLGSVLISHKLGVTFKDGDIYSEKHLKYYCRRSSDYTTAPSSIWFNVVIREEFQSLSAKVG